MEDKQENQEETRKPERDEHGRLLPGNTANPNGRPKGISLLSILKEKLGKTILVDGKEISFAEQFIEDYLRKTYDAQDGVAIRDIIDRIDGKPSQTNIIKTEKLNELAEAFKEIAKEDE